MYCRERSAGCHARCERYQAFYRDRRKQDKERLVKTMACKGWEKNRMKKYHSDRNRDKRKIKGN
jgi:hypothetical protein